MPEGSVQAREEPKMRPLELLKCQVGKFIEAELHRTSSLRIAHHSMRDKARMQLYHIPCMGHRGCCVQRCSSHSLGKCPSAAYAPPQKNTFWRKSE